MAKEGEKLKKVKFERLTDKYPWLLGALFSPFCSIGKSSHLNFQYIAVSKVHDLREFDDAQCSFRRVPERRLWRIVRWTLVYRVGNESPREAWLITPKEERGPGEYKTVKDAMEKIKSWYSQCCFFPESEPLIFMAVVRRTLDVHDESSGPYLESVRVKLF